MKFSTMVVSAALVLAGALLLTEARRYNSHSSYPGPNNAAGTSRYNGGSASSGSHYRRPSSTGPYHSYAVKPALYGGPKLYHYRGYARHPAHPAVALYSRRPRKNCNHKRAPRAHRRPTQYGPPQYSLPQYGLRPVNALVLAPAYHDSTSYSPAPRYPAPAGPKYNANNNGGHRANGGYRNNNTGAYGNRGGHKSGGRANYGSTASGYGGSSYRSARSNSYSAHRPTQYGGSGYKSSKGATGGY